MEHYFYLKEEPRQLFNLEHLAGIFSKLNKMSLLLQRKQLTIFVASDKIGFSSKTQNFKTLSSSPNGQFPNTNKLSHEISGHICICAFFNIVK